MELSLVTLLGHSQSHRQASQFSDGIVFGDTAGPIGIIPIPLTDGIVFSELDSQGRPSPIRNWSATATDGIKFNSEGTWYHRPTGEHDIFVKAFLEYWDWSAFTKQAIIENGNFVALPLVTNNRALPIITNFPVLNKTYNTEAS
jgi:hypothetical protein